MTSFLIDELIRFLQVGVAGIVVDHHLVDAAQAIVMLLAELFVFHPESPVRIALRKAAISSDLIHLLVIAHFKDDGKEIQAV